MKRSSEACSSLVSKALAAALCAVLSLTFLGVNARAEEANGIAVEAAQVEQVEAPEEELLAEPEDAVDVAPQAEPATPEQEPAPETPEVPEATDQADPQQEPTFEAQATGVSIKQCDITWPEDQEYTGQPVTPPVTITYNWTTLKEGIDYTLTYEDNVEEGMATVTVVGKGSYYDSDYDFFWITKRQISDCDITWPADQEYAGKPLTPPVVVKYHGMTLEKGVDYTVTYEDNAGGGLATVTVEGIGVYGGSKDGYFYIDAISLWDCSISSIPNQYFTGKGLKPKVTVTCDGEKLRAGVDYTLAYKDNVDIGTASVTIKGKGKCYGERTVYFNIVLDQGGWKKSGGKWWYSYAHGGYAKSVFLSFNDETYYFDQNGYMVTGWRKVDGNWFFFKSNGIMVRGWQRIGGKWYYFDRATGIMAIGFRKFGADWYYFTSSGAMKTGWQQVSGKWLYFTSSGSMAKGWQKVGGSWYYFDVRTGAMQTGWKNISGKRYWFANSGAMATGWKQIGGKYYYFESNGAMAKSKWVGSYYVQSNGVMATNTWIGRYHVNANGKWDKTR